MPSGDEEKISTAEHAETAEFFLQTKNRKHSGDISSSPRLPGPLQFGVLFLFWEKIFVSLGPKAMKKRG
jgi:hypothetical protein